MRHIGRDGPILIVDDCPNDRFITGVVLEQTTLDNPVVGLESGEALLSHLEEVTAGERPFPVLILLDVNLPGATGFEVLFSFRAQPEFSELPVVCMLTSSDAARDRERARALGADHFLAKQTGLDDFVALFNATFAAEQAA